MKNSKNLSPILLFFIFSSFILITLPCIPQLKAEEVEKVSLKNGTLTENNYIEGEIIIKYKPDKLGIKQTQDLEEAIDEDLIKEKIKTQIIEKLDSSESSLLKVKGVAGTLDSGLIQSDGLNSKEILEILKDNPDIEYAEPNYKRTLFKSSNDPYYSASMFGQWYFYDPTNDHDIDLDQAWDLEASSGPEVVIAVIDTGVNYNHPDLISNMWDGSSCKDVNGNPSSCPNHGWDFYDSDNDPMDSESHGTMVAGTIGAETNNSQGVAGVSYYNKLKIAALRTGDTSLSIFAIAQAIDFARQNEIPIINGSFGGLTPSLTEEEAIYNYQGLFIAAAGNDGYDNDHPDTPNYPCNYDQDNIICVGSTDKDDNLASYSNYGKTYVDIIAPGSEIVTPCYSSYCSGSGTSFSAPIVAGVTGLALSKYPTISNGRLKKIIINNNDFLDSLREKSIAEKRLNARKILASNQIPKYSVFRFWSDNFQGHFYTISIIEKNAVIDNYPDDWSFEGVAFNANQTKLQTSNKPVYRFWSDEYMHHFYTISETEKDEIVANWSDIWDYEGIAYYAFTSNQPGTTALHRFWSDTYMGHFYTTSETEKDQIIANWPDIWDYEGKAFYVY
jgi:hypothetical protein